MLSRLAWSLFAVAVVLVCADVAVAAQAVSLTSETAVAVHGFPLVHGASVGCALMGALIVSRYERHPIGWLLSVVGISTAVSLLAEAYAYWVLESDGPGSSTAGGIAAWVAQLFGGQISIAVLAWMFMLAPDGRFLSRRWRIAALVPGVGAALCLVAIVTVDPRTFELYDAEERWGPLRVTLLSIGFFLISIGLVLAAVSMVVRLRRSTGEDRQRLRPIVLSAALAATGLVVLLVVQSQNGDEQTWLAGVPLFLGFFLMPILFAVAVLRYRLYDLDVIINRAVVVAVGTAFAAAGYTVLVVLAGRQVEGRTGGFWLSLGALVVVALAFQPLRRMVIRLANRAAYGERAQPYEALTDFSRRLAAAPDPDDLLPAVAEAAARAVSGRGARVTLEVPGGDPVSGTWGWWEAGHEEPPDHVVRVESGGRTFGRIAVALPRGGSSNPSDRRLLEALADQTAVAFRNTSLAGTLADRVAELDRTTRRLAESRLRLIAADDAARRTLEAAISRRVLPFLAELPRRIGELRTAVDRGGSADRLDELVTGTNEALEALRELTRGVFPSQLARAGLAPTLGSLLGRASVEATLTVSGTGTQRHQARVEAAVYFCCAEAVAAATGRLLVELGGESDLVLRIRGTHGALDLAGITDRAAAAGGVVEVSDNLVELRIPVTRPVPSPVG